MSRIAKENTSLEQLKSFLDQLFQFDSQDLDFGVYKILHYKKKEIATFINQLLVNKVKAELQTLSADEAKQVQEQILEFEKDDIIKGWLEADESEKKTLEKFGKDKIKQYQELKVKATESSVSVETENQIYNHLTLFFSRYYDKGDFISKRRFGKNEKYVVPYNGEETHFHWANQDQYYIKSSETFNHYAFKVQTADSNLIVNFKLHNAQLEQGNVKAEETNFFMLSDKPPEIKEKDDSDLQFVLANRQPDVNEKEITIYFEYRPLGDDEKKKVKGNSKQDTLDEIAFDFLKKEFGINPIFANLWKPVLSKTEGEQEGKPLLLKKLQHYTRKNKHDFFIHKNLKGFLERELDYYIKSELVNIDDLYVSDTDAHFKRLKHNLKTIKVFKSIADIIIAFVSQIEDFQKKLWEKKKFVLSTEWVITIDRLVEYVGEQAAKPILEEVIKNEKQVTEWKELFGESSLKNQPTSVESLKADLLGWFKYPIDTVYFDHSFKENLLNILSEKLDLDDDCEGFVLHGDNYHGIKAIRDKFTNSLKCVYLDPPYNTPHSQIIYKNSFKHSSWLTLIGNRLEESKDLLSANSMLTVAIDDYEMVPLCNLTDKIYSDRDRDMIIVNHHPQGSGGINVSRTHEYALVLTPRNIDVLEGEKKDDYIEHRNFKRSGTAENNFRYGRKNSFYAVLVDPESKKIMGTEPPPTGDDYPLEDTKEGYKRIYPLSADGTERVWRTSFNSKNIATLPERLISSDTYTIYQVIFHEGKRKEIFSNWTDTRYNAGTQGSSILKGLFGGTPPFSYPKSIYTVRDLIDLGTHSDHEAITLDYFGGSGTTAHAIQLLNKEYEGEGTRKFILVEQGPYTCTVIIPRIKKIAYTFDWKDGKPKGGRMNGLGVFFKYQRLEQYEEALENIAFNASEDAVQKALEFEQYIPKYFLEFETRGGQSIVNTAAMQDPWDYKLKVWDGFTYDTEQAVDLVETFNYLIGLHMQKCITKELNGKKYQFIYGHNNANKNILVVWRSVKDWSVDDFKADAATLKTELKAFEYDLLYINDQAHIEGYQPIEEVFKNKMLP
jgi:adenine-specific DNA-methyltransferase